MSKELFIGSVLKGITDGFVKGMELNQNRFKANREAALKREELEVRKKTLAADTTYKNQQIEIGMLKTLSGIEDSKRQAVIDKYEADIKKLEVDRKALKDMNDDRWQTVNHEMDAMRLKLEDIKMQKDFEYKNKTLKQKQDQFDKDQKAEDERLKIKNDHAEKMAKLKADIGVDERQARALDNGFKTLMSGDSVYKQVRQAYMEIPSVRQSWLSLRRNKQPNTVALNNLKAQIARIRESGRLTDDDVKRYTKSESLQRRIKDTLTSWVKGVYSDETMVEIGEIIDFMETQLGKNKKDIEERHINSLHNRHKIPRDKIRKAFGITERTAKVPSWEEGSIRTYKGRKVKVVKDKNGVLGIVPYKE